MQSTTQTTATAPAPKLLRLPATLDRVGLGRTMFLDLVREGKAPKKIKIGRCCAWVESEIEAWITDRIRQSRKG